jgi:hypothetical protein
MSNVLVPDYFLDAENLFEHADSASLLLPLPSLSPNRTFLPITNSILAQATMLPTIVCGLHRVIALTCSPWDSVDPRCRKGVILPRLPKVCHDEYGHADCLFPTSSQVKDLISSSVIPSAKT